MRGEIVGQRRYVEIIDTEDAGAEGTDISMDGESHGYLALTSNPLYEFFKKQPLYILKVCPGISS